MSQILSSKHVWAGFVDRFVILDGPTMPIIGEGDKEANDRFFFFFTKFSWRHICMCLVLCSCTLSSRF